jgi:DNA-binding transcriptional LysR family regulator
MRLSNRQLTAFMTVAATLNFTRAAERLGLTQSALSHRIRQLENDLGTVLLNRSSHGSELTDSGNRVLRFCHTSASLEEEILMDLGTDPQGPVKGVIRIAAHSSILQPILLPALAPFLRENPLVQCELLCVEAKNLPGVLKGGEAELVIMDRLLDWSNLTTHLLGNETYLAVGGISDTTRNDVYLDLDAQDRVTEEFFRHQKNPPKYRRSFLSNVFGIIAGVEYGLGRAVVSRHLIQDNPAIKVLSQYDPVSSPVVLHHHTQPSYTRLHNSILEILCRACPEYLD